MRNMMLAVGGFSAGCMLALVCDIIGVDIARFTSAQPIPPIAILAAVLCWWDYRPFHTFGPEGRLMD